jgi:hypothetical protein
MLIHAMLIHAMLQVGNIATILGKVFIAVFTTLVCWFLMTDGKVLHAAECVCANVYISGIHVQVGFMFLTLHALHLSYGAVLLRIQNVLTLWMGQLTRFRFLRRTSHCSQQP